MNPTANPPVDPRIIEETRRHINRLVEEVGRLAESEMCRRSSTANSSSACCQPWPRFAGASSGRARRRATCRWPFRSTWARSASTRARTANSFTTNCCAWRCCNRNRCTCCRTPAPAPPKKGRLRSRQPHRLPAAAGARSAQRPGGRLPRSLAEPHRPLNAVTGFLSFLTMPWPTCARTRQPTMGQMIGQRQVWTQLEAFARQIHSSLKPLEVGYLIANEGRRLVDCDRVTVGVRQGRRTRVEAVSGSDIVEKRLEPRRPDAPSSSTPCSPGAKNWSTPAPRTTACRRPCSRLSTATSPRATANCWWCCPSRTNAKRKARSRRGRRR